MALSQPRTIFGVHGVSFKNRTTGEYTGMAKVVDTSSIAINSELISLTGGSQKFPWAIENGPSSAEISLSLGQYDSFLIEAAYGKKPTENAAEANGSVTTLTNKYGTLVEATTGIASVALTSLASTDLKFGEYVVKAVTATTCDVFLSTDIDLGKGTAGEYQNDLLKITAAPITILDAGATTALSGYGVEFAGGSGTVAMEVGDTATFSVRPPNSKSMDVIIGGASDVVPEVGMMLYSQERGTGEKFMIEVYRAKLTGLPFGFTKFEWSQAEITAQAFYDSENNGVLRVEHVTPV